MNDLPQYLNITGLLCDGIGVIMLFRKIGGFSKIKRAPDHGRLQYIRTRLGGGDPITEGFRSIVKEVNSIIDEWAAKNERNHKGSIKWIFLICLGFTLQLLASIIQLYE